MSYTFEKQECSICTRICYCIEQQQKWYCEACNIMNKKDLKDLKDFYERQGIENLEA